MVVPGIQRDLVTTRNTESKLHLQCVERKAKLLLDGATYYLCGARYD